MDNNFFEKHKKKFLIAIILFLGLCIFAVVYNSPSQKIKRVSKSIDQIIDSYTEETAENEMRYDIRNYLYDNPLRMGSKYYEEYMQGTVQRLIDKKECVKFCEFLIGLSGGYNSQDLYNYVFDAIGQMEVIDRIEWMACYKKLIDSNRLLKIDEFYSLENISKEEIEEYVKDNKEKISTEKYYGGYYSNKKSTKEKGNHGLTTKTDSYYGDFKTYKETGERLDNFYEIHKVDEYKIYFRDHYIEYLEEFNLDKFEYAPPLLVYTTESNKLNVYLVPNDEDGIAKRVLIFD